MRGGGRVMPELTIDFKMQLIMALPGIKVTWPSGGMVVAPHILYKTDRFESEIRPLQVVSDP
jgi:hypothetical protein